MKTAARNFTLPDQAMTNRRRPLSLLLWALLFGMATLSSCRHEAPVAPDTENNGGGGDDDGGDDDDGD